MTGISDDERYTLVVFAPGHPATALASAPTLTGILNAAITLAQEDHIRDDARCGIRDDHTHAWVIPPTVTT